MQPSDDEAVTPVSIQDVVSQVISATLVLMQHLTVHFAMVDSLTTRRHKCTCRKCLLIVARKNYGSRKRRRRTPPSSVLLLCVCRAIASVVCHRFCWKAGFDFGFSLIHDQPEEATGTSTSLTLLSATQRSQHAGMSWPASQQSSEENKV